MIGTSTYEALSLLVQFSISITAGITLINF
ncbi:putative holin-like toxin [Ornithinibacillus halophilus]